MSLFETMIASFAKSFDFEKLANSPKVQEMTEIAKGVAADFKTIKAQNADILARLDRLENLHHTPAPEKFAGVDITFVGGQSNGKC